jgi:hypothetical protein
VTIEPTKCCTERNCSGESERIAAITPAVSGAGSLAATSASGSMPKAWARWRITSTDALP